MGSWRKGGNSQSPRHPRECPFQLESQSEVRGRLSCPVRQPPARRPAGDGEPRRLESRTVSHLGNTGLDA